MFDNLVNLLQHLNKIGIALSVERNIEKLLKKILDESMIITNSDGGSLYIKRDFSGENKLVFEIAVNKSRSFPFTNFSLPINNKSIAGFVAFSGKTLNIDDVENLPPEIEVKYNRDFDDKIRYKTINMLVIPMKDYNGIVIGVLQLINKKKLEKEILTDVNNFKNQVMSFSADEESVIESLASQAAVLIERTKLYNEIESLLQSITETLVATLETRDLTTSGHSKRVAGYAVEMLRTINKIDYGKYKDVFFTKEQEREIYYAGLLHDIGKIGVSENILGKAHKITNERLELIKMRFSCYKLLLERKIEKEGLSEEEEYCLKNIEEMYEFIRKIGKGFFITDEDVEKVEKISKIEFENITGEKTKLIDDFEKENLTIKYGNLTIDERNEINRHVIYTVDILKKMKWGESFKNVEKIAGSHHERIDGTGYPEGLVGDDIPIQGRILALLDIFEALTARDRPYKPPMTVERALEILEKEVEARHIDVDLFEIFIKERVYEIYKKELNRIK